MPTLALRCWGCSVLALITQSQERRAIRALQALDNRTLADIGITRGEIAFAVRHGRPSAWDLAGARRTVNETRATKAMRKRVPPLHVFLLLGCLVPFGGLMSFASFLSGADQPAVEENQVSKKNPENLKMQIREPIEPSDKRRN
jgi:uncharacterized protein YjiS (DUF1127 family)